ncbi:hypothetical protein [Tenggerimyces flavus]|uniref:Uncharacterized protein n=1 Tax=Tenggerimyces flavus TaxID=1708749 RepID=A0ABV7YQM2_9ACTN|nr:hypothetical protein [Tenggerimyces flavus]MBM7786452.1 hypothetical protein [Tenggerimyces flavus]
MIARPRSARALLFAAFLVLLAIPAGLPGPTPEAKAAGVSETKQLSRTHVNPDGSQGTPETKDVTVNVSQVDGLQGRQRIEVTWSGAKPSQGYDIRVEDAVRYNTEYPVVLMQCRGADTSTTSIDPKNCLTSNWQTRVTEDYAMTWDPITTVEGAPWLLDRYASAQDKTVSPPVPKHCSDFWTGAATVHFLPFVDTAGKSWYYCNLLSDPSGQAQDVPPDVSFQSALPPNDQFQFADANGSGRAVFEIRRKEQNASLGCSETVACSLVVVPIMGISCDLASNPDPTMRQLCTSTGNNPVGPLDNMNPQLPARAVKGDLWWSASNWRNRFSFKLGFAPSASFCDVQDTRTPVDFYGSELIGEATLQWAPAFCLDKNRFKLRHQRTGEPRAKSLIDSGGAPAAFVSRPPEQAPTRSTVYAPAAVSGFAIGYFWKSDPTTFLQDLKLTPRLLAKLITQSYPTSLGRAAPSNNWPGHPTVSGNPANMSLDPEFQKLNPNVLSGDVGAAALTAISPDSDVIWELTRYIEADPVARAWLDGVPDEYGMVVNPKFRGIKLPFETLQLLDDWIVPPTNGLTPCADDQPTQYLNQVFNPLSNFGATGYAGLDGQPSSLTDCALDGATNKNVWKRASRAQATVALMSLADIDLYKVPAASLQTRPGTFVKPSFGSLRTATRLLKKDAATSTWSLDQKAIRSNEVGRNAYPGTMIVYTAATTEKLDKKIAEDVAQFMRFSVTDGQTPGSGNGKLPDGYLPISDETGLGFLKEQAMKAADAVENQTAEPPEPEPSTTPTPEPSVPNQPPPGANNANNPNSPNNPGAGPPGGGNGNNNPPGPTDSPTGGTPTPNPNPTSGPTPSSQPSGQEEAERALTSAATRGDQSVLARWALPMLLLAGLVGGVLAPLVSAASRPGHPVRVALDKAMTRFRK